MASKLPVHAIPVGLTIISILITNISAFTESIDSASYGEEKLSTVVVQGSVFCDICLQRRFSETSYFLPGALVAVECSLNRKATSVSSEGETDEYGDFRVEIPSIFHAEDRVNRCSVRLLSSPEGSCNVIQSASTPRPFTLTSNFDGVRTYDAGSFSYRPKSVDPRLCSKELDRDEFTWMSSKLEAEGIKTSESSPRAPPVAPFLPPLPKLSFPRLPTFNFPPFPFQFSPVPFLNQPSTPTKDQAP